MKRRERRHVTTREHHGDVKAEKVRQLSFELTMNLECAHGDTRGTGRRAKLPHGVTACLNDLRVTAEIEIVIAAKVNELIRHDLLEERTSYYSFSFTIGTKRTGRIFWGINLPPRLVIT